VHIDWAKLFAFDTPALEIVIRGTVTYFAILVMLRFAGRRETGTVGITNLLTIVLLADAAQNAMAGDYTSVPDGVLLVGTIVFWSWFIDWAKFRSARFARVIDPPPLTLVKDGRLLPRNMRIEMITEDELMSQLRLQGVDDLAHVKRACIESDGRISVVPRDGKSATSGNNERRAA
jgi:uncharacterized membrane protein YcaP (DUF421 family)